MRCSQPVLWRYAWRPTVEMGVAGRVDSPEKPRINYAFFFVLDYTPYHIPIYLFTFPTSRSRRCLER